MSSLLIQNGQLVTEQGINRASILIEDNIIKELTAESSELTADKVIDATDLLIFPGLIDCHVHFREPGNTDAEDMESGAASAIAGGVTTVCDMPNTNPPTCTREALADKIERAKRIEGCDIRFFFGITQMSHLKELESVDTNDICGVKLYFDHSTGDQKANEDVIEEAFELCAKKNLTVVCHAEDAEINAAAKKLVRQDVIEAHSLNRPVASEVKAIKDAIALSKKHGTHLHIAHLSTSDGLDLVKKAKAEGVNVTCEVAPHHLFLSVDDYETLGTLAKMNPPLRTRDHCEALMKGVIDGSVDCIATDHAPHTLKSKQSENPMEAPSGVPGVETMLPLLLNAGIEPQRILSLCFTLPNRIFNLGKTCLPAVAPSRSPTSTSTKFEEYKEERRLGKPEVQVGKPADLTLVNPGLPAIAPPKTALTKKSGAEAGQSWRIHEKDLKSKCGWTPYEGWKVTGRVVDLSSAE